jgi:hypothetical protein
MLNLARSIPPQHSASPPGPASSPPRFHPEEFEDHPAFRETFLLYFTDPGANATLRNFGRLLHELVLEFWGMWPPHPEGIFEAELRAAVADLRHIEGSLMAWTGPATSLEDSRDARLARLGAEIAGALGALTSRLEGALDAGRSET